MPYAPAFIRSAPPTVPGTPIKPSMPPKSFFAQNVTVRPRSAAASTRAKFPSSTTSGSRRTNCSITQGSSPSPTRRLEPPPRNLCAMPFASSRLRRSGMVSCFLIRSRSVIPPIPNEVSSDNAAPCRSSTPSPGSADTILGLSMRMMRGMLRPEQNHQLVAGAADIACANGQYGVACARRVQQVFDAFLHRAEVENIFVSGLANGVYQGFARHTGNGRFARRVNIRQHENVGLVESAAEFVPQVLRARVAVWLKENEQAMELAAARSFERRTNLRRVMAVVVNHGDVVDHALDVEAACNPRKPRKPFAD